MYLTSFLAFVQPLLISALAVPPPQSPLLRTTPQPADPSTYRIPTVEESAALAREILRNESIATLSTVFPSSSAQDQPRHSEAPTDLDHDIEGKDGSNDELTAWENRPNGLEGMAIGLMDYYADCESNGNPTILAISIATSFKNTASGSNMSMSIRQHPYTTASFQSEGEYSSPAAHARFSLLGHIEPIPESEVEAQGLKQCFLHKHPDAVAWLPGNRIHESWWARLVVEEVYWVGGFGDRAYIGWIPVDVWRDAMKA
ncbi:MAG: hypothetical protein M1828_002619 [Chrysothrix sp. TS-e1954]|nr:MAG: hypothetical protein M1828_002619 [Chrysothrix sp. TS-e1954]